MNRDMESTAEFETLRRKLLQAVRRRCPAWLSEQSEDLVQEALVKVMELQQRSGGEREFSTGYLVQTAYCRLIDEIRRRRVRREVPLEPEPGDAKHEPVAAHPGPERLLVSRQAAAAVRDCLLNLHPPRRRAVTLHLHGHSARQLCELMGWKLRQAQNLVHRGLQDLRRCLQTKGISTSREGVA